METQSEEKLHNQDDVNPTSQLDKIVVDEKSEAIPNTNGTGGNRPVQTEGTVVIKED
ncbi:MAG: hypothetical protein WKF66_14170 [Pedobacter sp.]